MRGGGSEEEEEEEEEEVSQATQTLLEFNRLGSVRRRSLLGRVKESEREEELGDLTNLSSISRLVSLIRGGGSPSPSQGAASPRKQSDFTPITNSAMGFQPIPGVMSPQQMTGMISPPPMMMPTPIQGNQFMSMGSNIGGLTSPLLMPAAEGTSPQQPTMAFTYVPVPVYNLGGMGMQMMPGKIYLQ